MIGLNRVEAAIEDLKAGKLVLILDDDDRENEGDLIGSASLATAEMINFMITEARGAFIAAFMPFGLCDRLGIPKMLENNKSFNETQFRVSVDALSGGSGSSASDRAKTVKLLADPETTPDMFVRPGHVVPIEAHPQGLRGRRGHTEAGVALMELAGFPIPVAVDLEVLNRTGDMASRDELLAFAQKFKLNVLCVEDIVEAVAPKARNSTSSACAPG